MVVLGKYIIFAENSYNMDNALLNKSECSFLKGIAIIFIILHNYCHEFPSAIEANEFQWIQKNFFILFKDFFHPSYYFISDLFSYWGHYGIVIFLFISGYGLVIKYEKTPTTYYDSKFVFIKKHYIKLFNLMIWGFLFNIIANKLCIGYFFHDKWTIPGQLLFIINLIPNAHINPGPYWYLGMTLQLYIIYIILISKRSDIPLFFILSICLILQINCEPDGNVIYWMRRNFIGCFLPFSIGIIYARHHILTSMKYAFFIICLLIAVVIVCNFNYYLWLITPLFIVPMSIRVTKLCAKCKILFLWVERIGNISSTIFIMHPIAHWLILPSEDKRPYIYIYIILYSILSIFLGLIYNLYLNHLTNGISYFKYKRNK